MERATEEECRVVEDRYLDQLEEIVRYSLPKGKSVAGFFAESIQGVGGSVQYPRGYLKRAFQVNCKLCSVLWILSVNMSVKTEGLPKEFFTCPIT